MRRHWRAVLHVRILAAPGPGPIPHEHPCRPRRRRLQLPARRALVFTGPVRSALGGRKRRRDPARPPGAGVRVSLVFSLVAAFSFAWWLGPAPSLPTALASGAVAGFGLVAASFGINYQFAQRSIVLWLIDGGYHTVQFLLFGLVLGLWH
ncbi:DUF1761 domain-containing protein [Stenotrophomonas sp. Marseille-Q4652]|uniref:DUF1761 domain-containing protein n=1 Tax=Stenotrophomonas sp. Marseille-Q4652 TaxID=2866595 RepID=UPI00298F0154|nr:DUF1761 domain-containing protein [Stenotrophomonas sp. Marseille-Q4652]